jgi:hypothetical protein
MTKVKFIKSSLAFLLITSSILFGIQSFLDYKMSQVKSGNVGKINKVLQNKVDEDMTIWGASTAEGNFVPQIISEKVGVSVFNMGLDGTNIHQYGGLIKTYLNQVTNKNVVISFDIHGGLMRRDAPYLIYNWLHVYHVDSISKTFNNIDYSLSLKIKYVPFYKLVLYGKHNIKYLKEDLNDFQIKRQGFVPGKGIIDVTKMVYEPTEFQNDSTVLASIKGICELASKNNNKITLVVTPCFYKGLEQGVNVNSIIKNFQSLENRNVSFLNFVNHPMNTEKKYFRDNIHLNKEGAECFSKVFANRISTLVK